MRACGGVSAVLAERLAEDDDRRAKAGVPEEITFKTKPQIALEQIRWRARSVFPAAWRWTPATATIPSCARVSLTLESAIAAFSRRCWCGSRRAAGPGTEKGAP